MSNQSRQQVETMTGMFTIPSDDDPYFDSIVGSKKEMDEREEDDDDA